MNYYKRHLGDYAKNTRTLTTYEHGVYTLLLDLYYTDEAPLSLEDAIAVCRASTPKEAAAVSRVLSRYFDEKDGRWHNGRADEEIANYHEKAVKNAAIGALGGRQKAKRNASETLSETLGECLANENPSHKPLAISQGKDKKPPPAPSLSADDLVADGLDISSANEFLSHRRRKHAVLTALAWRGFKSEVAKAGWTLPAAVEKAISRGWTSFEATWVSGDPKPNGAVRIPEKTKTLAEVGL